MGLLLRFEESFNPRLVRQESRFSMPKEVADSLPHRKAAIREAVAKMIGGMRSYKGLEYVDDGTLTVGPPEAHIHFDDSDRVDPGPVGQPDPRDVKAWGAWERAEKARTARNAGEIGEWVDFVITANYVQRRSPLRTYRASLPGIRA